MQRVGGLCEYRGLKFTHHSPVQSWRGRALVWQPCHSLSPANNRQTKGPTRETGERGSAVCGVECTRHNSATGNAKYTELPAVNVN